MIPSLHIAHMWFIVSYTIRWATELRLLSLSMNATICAEIFSTIRNVSRFKIVSIKWKLTWIFSMLGINEYKWLNLNVNQSLAMLNKVAIYRVVQKSCKWGIPKCRIKYENNKERVKQRRWLCQSIFCHMQQISHQKSFSHSIVKVMCMCLRVNENLPC